MAVFICYISLQTGLQNTYFHPVLVMVRESNEKYIF